MNKAMTAACALMLGSMISCAGSKTESATTCIDPGKINPDAICTMQYEPVCGCDGKTYSNPCVADNAGVTAYTQGECGTGNN